MARVWQPGQIGPLMLRHRLVMGSMHLGIEAEAGGGDAMAAFYSARAGAGADLIVTGGSAVSRVGAAGKSYGFINEDETGVQLARIPEAVHAHGGRVLLQLFHSGRYGYEHAFGLQPVAPSAVYSQISRCEPRALSQEEILETIDDFARGALRATELGFDGVEIMGSEGYLLNQFTAPLTNVREDEWGGDRDGRLRFPVEVTRAVRGAAGDAAAVVYRLSGADLVKGSTPQEDVLELARRLTDAGLVDAINVGVGWHEARVPTVQSLVPKGVWAPYARAVREALTTPVPVITSNRVNNVSVAEALLAAGDADFVSLARPFLADPQFVAKTRDGSAPVNVCIACNWCIERSIGDRQVSCVVNPRAGHESTVPDGSALGARGAAVAVVGGGPAGMEAARALAVDGHRVTLLEAGERIGGQFWMAARIPGKEDFAGTVTYFEAELARLGVNVRTGTSVMNVAELAEFDFVVVASGVTPRTVPIPGSDLPHVFSYADVLAADPSLAERIATGTVAILGGGGIGVDTAHLLCALAGDGVGSSASFDGLARERDRFRSRYALNGAPERRASGSRVTVMRRAGRIGAGVGAVNRWAIVQELEWAGVRLLTDITYDRIEPGSVLITTASGAPERIAAETVIIAAGQEPSRALLDDLAATGTPHLAVGGSAGAERLDAARAFRQGFEAPAAVAAVLAAN